jgi:aminoglycoside phosphotransferase (APT) family kinase protein
MRTNIYYWKCDSPLPAESKRAYNDKYALADISEIARSIAADHFGRLDVSAQPAGVSGNHYAYIVRSGPDAAFFRADDGKLDDDYMLAEQAVIDLVRARGIPAPHVYRVDASMSRYPIRYQLMELVPGQCLNELHRAGALDKSLVGLQAGRHIAALHAIELDGFGFLNTELLARGRRLVGLDSTNRSYFYKRLEDHLRFVLDHDFLSSQEVRSIEELFRDHDHLLSLDRGSVLHKDLAFWNMVGEPSRIRAIVDWDDVVIGDPVDDLAILKCFYQDDVFLPVLQGYQEIRPLPDRFLPKLWLYLIRNMLWKTVIRITMNYFEMEDRCFIANRDNGGSLRQFTYERLLLGIRELQKC